MTARHSLAAKLDEKLDQVLKNPRGWGGVDALEPLVLMLLILRAETADPPSSHVEVVQRYQEFLAQRLSPGGGDILERLGEELSLEAVVDVLREHVEAIRGRGAQSPRGKGSSRATPPARASRPGFPWFVSIESEVRH